MRGRLVSDRKCEHPGCDRKHWSKGLCKLHTSRKYQGIDLDAPLRKFTPKNLVGLVVGKLTVLEKFDTYSWVCLCTCGRRCVVFKNHLVGNRKKTESCGACIPRRNRVHII